MLLTSRVVRLLAAASVLMTVALGAGAEPAPKSGAEKLGTPTARLITARGVVKSVSATRLALETAEPGKGSEMILALDEKTIVMKGRKVLATKEVQRGDAVTVGYVLENGRALAKRIWLRSPEKSAGAGSSLAPRTRTE